MTLADALIHGPASWALAFSLGVRHGLDADHLATIDGLTRYNATARPSIARWCGVLFALGHGGILIVLAVLAGTAVAHVTVPEWTRTAGALSSIGLLIVLGLMNLVAIARTPRHEVVALSSVRNRLARGLTSTSHPLAIVGIGALFAVSFDTLTQALLLATSAESGRFESAALLSLFLIGMATADGLNSAWIATLLARADRRARIASRVMGLVVALLSLTIAALGAARLFNEDLDRWFALRDILPGLCVILIVGLCFAITVRERKHSKRGVLMHTASSPTYRQDAHAQSHDLAR